MKMVL